MKHPVLRSLVYASLLAATIATPALAGGDKYKERRGDKQRGATYEEGRSSSREDRRMSFGLDRNPQWEWVRGTRVMVIRAEDRPDYDMFRYNNSYYVYHDGSWYRSNHWRGEFRVMNARSVPTVFKQVPREYWVSYPTTWSERKGDKDKDDRWDRDRDRDRDDDGTEG